MKERIRRIAAQFISTPVGGFLHRHRKGVLDAIRWLLTIGIFYYLFTKKVDVSNLWKTVRSAEIGWLLAAVGLFAVTFWFGVLRWHLLLKTQDIVLPFRRVLAIGFVGHFFNSFLLGATGGDVIKAYYAARQTETHKHEAVLSVFVDRIIGLVGLFVIAFVMMVWNARWLYHQPNLRLPCAFVIFLIGSAMVAIPTLPFVLRLTDRFKGLAKLRGHLARVRTAYSSYFNHRRTLLWTLLLSVGVHATIIVGIIFIGQGLGVDELSPDRYFLMVPVINTIASIPITPAGLGVREGMYVRMFADFGIASEEAVVISLLSFGAQLVWSLIGGLVYLFWKHEPHMLQHAREELGREEQDGDEPTANR